MKTFGSCYGNLVNANTENEKDLSMLPGLLCIFEGSSSVMVHLLCFCFCFQLKSWVGVGYSKGTVNSGDRGNYRTNSNQSEFMAPNIVVSNVEDALLLFYFSCCPTLTNRTRLRSLPLRLLPPQQRYFSLGRKSHLTAFPFIQDFGAPLINMTMDTEHLFNIARDLKRHPQNQGCRMCFANTSLTDEPPYLILDVEKEDSDE